MGQILQKKIIVQIQTFGEKNAIKILKKLLDKYFVNGSLLRLH